MKPNRPRQRPSDLAVRLQEASMLPFLLPIPPSLHQWRLEPADHTSLSPAPSPYKIRRALAPPYTSSLPPRALSLTHSLLAHTVAGVRGASPELVPRRSLPAETAEPSLRVEFIPAHEQEPKVEDNPKMLIYFLNHFLN
jgi:hypothetical protein